MSLSEEEKQKIAEEELFREHVREEYAESQKRKNFIKNFFYLLFLCSLCMFVLFAISNSSDSTDSSVTSEIISPEEIGELSQLYCDIRNSNDRYYPVINKSSDQFEFNNKTGKDLILSDCINNINILKREGYRKDELEKIANNKFWIGMPELGLVASLGLPNDRNETVFSFSESSQYIYGDVLHETLYIYVDNGKVSSYQIF